MIKINLSLKIILTFFVVFGFASYFLLNLFFNELKPGLRQSSEEVLVDMANVLAEVVSEEYAQFHTEKERNLSLDNSDFSLQINRFIKRHYQAKIFDIKKENSDLRIYITNDKGIVVYDSMNIALGQDYSLWNDVYLTLKGEYGVRSTQSDPDNEESSVMYVAAPIYHHNRIVGVLTVAKPSLSLEPYFEQAKKQDYSASLITGHHCFKHGCCSFLLVNPVNPKTGNLCRYGCKRPKNICSRIA